MRYSNGLCSVSSDLLKSGHQDKVRHARDLFGEKPRKDKGEEQAKVESITLLMGVALLDYAF